MKKYLLMIIVLGLLSINPQQTDALSCLFSPSFVAEIQSDLNEQNESDFLNYGIGDGVYLNGVTVDTIPQHQDILDQYLSDTIPDEFVVTDDSQGYHLTEDVRLPLGYEDSIEIGDIVVAGGRSTAACGGPGTYSLFDSEGEYKFTYYRAFGYSNEIPTYQLTPTPVGPSETNTMVMFTDTEGNNFSLSTGEEYAFEDGSRIHLLNIKNKTDQIWFGGSYFTFVIVLDDEIIATPASKCSINYSRLVRYGVIGDDVAEVQSCLNALGYDTGKVDGWYGNNTYRGITEFQTAQSIKIDGIVGPQTVSYLNNF